MISQARNLWIGVSALAFATSGAVALDRVLQADHMIDGVTGTLQGPVSILIHDDRISKVSAGRVAVPGAQTIDLGSVTLMPGLIDCHIHLNADLPGGQNALERDLTNNDIDRAFVDAVNARAMLMQGFTAARDLGGGDDTVALRGAIEAGHVVGPRLWTALEPLGPTGGHGDNAFGMDRALSNPSWQNGLVESVDQARFKVREHFRRGANVIKLMPSGGIASTGDNPNAQTMTDSEIREAVATAHGLGLKVAAHLYPPLAIKAAVEAGVDSVEHGSFADADTYRLMKAHGTYLVPTLSVFEIYYRAAKDHPETLRPGTAAKEIANDPIPKQHFPAAVKSGVKIAYGTDLGAGDHALEFDLMVQGGMSAGDAILSASSHAAELLGARSDIGSLEAGHMADIIAVPGDPLKDISLMHRVQFVMKGGIIYKRDDKPDISAFQ